MSTVQAGRLAVNFDIMFHEDPRVSAVQAGRLADPSVRRSEPAAGPRPRLMAAEGSRRSWTNREALSRYQADASQLRTRWLF